MTRSNDMMMLLALNLAGTFVFGISGGLAGVRAKLDLFGVLVLSTVVGLAGGVLRDVLIGIPPQTFRDWRYLVAVGAAGLISFFGGVLLQRYQRAILLFDAIGLSLFCVTGASLALTFRLGPLQAILLGTLTAIGGGMLRDVLLRDVPIVLRRELYAVPAILGATVVTIARQAGSSSSLYLLADRQGSGVHAGEDGWHHPRGDPLLELHHLGQRVRGVIVRKVRSVVGKVDAVRCPQKHPADGGCIPASGGHSGPDGNQRHRSRVCGGDLDRDAVVGAHPGGVIFGERTAVGPLAGGEVRGRHQHRPGPG